MSLPPQTELLLDEGPRVVVCIGNHRWLVSASHALHVLSEAAASSQGLWMQLRPSKAKRLMEDCDAQLMGPEEKAPAGVPLISFY